MACVCGHSFEDHRNPLRPRASSCGIDGCDCVHFEPDEEEFEGEEDGDKGYGGQGFVDEFMEGGSEDLS